MPTLVRLPACSPEGKFDIIDPSSVSAILAYPDNQRCVVMLKGHSEEGGYSISLPQHEAASRLGITVVDRIE